MIQRTYILCNRREASSPLSSSSLVSFVQIVINTCLRWNTFAVSRIHFKNDEVSNELRSRTQSANSGGVATWRQRTEADLWRYRSNGPRFSFDDLHSAELLEYHQTWLWWCSHFGYISPHGCQLLSQCQCLRSVFRHQSRCTQYRSRRRNDRTKSKHISSDPPSWVQWDRFSKRPSPRPCLSTIQLEHHWCSYHGDKQSDIGGKDGLSDHWLGGVESIDHSHHFATSDCPGRWTMPSAATVRSNETALCYR